MRERHRGLGAGRWALLAFGAAIVVMLVGWVLTSGTAGYGAGWMMPGARGNMAAVAPLMFVGMVLVWVAVSLGVVALVRWESGSASRQAGAAPEALEIARQRYARGEISREEYERIRDDLTRAA